MASCRFSILMAAYNAEKYIGDAIRSVLAQTFSDWQLIVVDDASTDTTASVVSPFCTNPSVALLRMENNSGGAFRPRLIGLEAAEGEFVVEFDADDILDSGYLAALDAALRSSGADIALADIVEWPSGLPVAVFAGETDVISGEEALWRVVSGHPLSGMGAFRRSLYSSALSRYGMPEGGMSADEILTRMIFSCAGEVIMVPGAVYRYRSHPESITRSLSLRRFGAIEGAFSTLRLSNLAGSSRVWHAASAEFLAVFVSMARIYNSFPFESEDDRNDVRARLRSMYDLLRSSSRFRFVGSPLLKLALSIGFTPYLKILRLHDSSRKR